MRFGCQMHHSVRLPLMNKILYSLTVCDVYFMKTVPGRILHLIKIVQIRSVGKLVDRGNFNVWVCVVQFQNKVRTYKACASGYNNFFHDFYRFMSTVTLFRTDPHPAALPRKVEIGRAHVLTPVTLQARMLSSTRK